jgi:multidrug efflux pump subunit AcrB
MTPTQAALQYRPLTYLLTIVLMATGIYALFALPRREDPDLSARFAQVVAIYPGASAAQVEQLVTDRLERTIREVDAVGTVTSVSRPGLSVVEFQAADKARDLPKMMKDIRNRADDLRGDLPVGVTSVIVNDRFSDTAAMVFAVSKIGASDRDREDIAKKLRARLQRLSDISEAKLIGEQQEVITVSLSATRLAQMGVSAAQVAEAIARANVLPQSGGSLSVGATRLTIEPTNELRTETDLSPLVIGQGINGQPVYLRDVASVSRGYKDPSPYVMRVNGEPAVGVTVTLRKGGNISDMGVAVEQELAPLRKELPDSVRITAVNDLPRSVKRRMGEFFENLGAGIALIFAVMFLFMGLRSALIVGAMLPITILGTFAAMMAAGRDIQQMSIAALIIALGLVVDNSIVVIDNIEKKMTEGLDAETAAIAGVNQLLVPLITSNLTTIASFAPLMFLSGGVGEFVKDLGIVTSLSTIVSVILNVTVTPLLAIAFLRPGHPEKTGFVQRGMGKFIDGLRAFFSSVAQRGLRRPFITVTVAVAVMAFAFGNIGRLGSQFFPLAERDQFTVDVWLPEGRDIKATGEVATRVERIIASKEGVRNFVTHIGRGGPRFYYNINPEPPTANYAQIIVNTESIAATKRLTAAVQKEANATIAEARVTARILEQGPPVGAPIAVRLIGDNITDLRRAAADIKAILNETPGAASVHDNYGEMSLRLKVDVDTDRAAALGLSPQSVAQFANLAFSGQTAALLREGDREIPIDLRLSAEERTKPGDLLDLYLPSPSGIATALRQVARISLEGQSVRIVRRNGVRTLTVSAFSDGSRLPSAILSDVQKRIVGLKMPSGVSAGYGGEAEEVGKSFVELVFILMLSLAANLAIVVWEFNSFKVAWTVMAAVPFGITGAIAGLFMANQPFGFMAFVGIISLGGVVTNHAIVLFEYALEEQRKGLPLADALVEAGRLRLRPILLTVVLSIGGLIPQAVNGGNLWPPMAWALIAGLLGSLVLTLIVVPSVYAVLAGTRERRESDRRSAVNIPTAL